MSKQIDERVVSMRFDNAQFEKNVSTSISTLDKLKKSLNLEGASKGLENINSEVKRVDVSPLSNGLETVKVKFSALEVMAVTALSNITNSAINAGTQLVKSISVDQISAGWSKYGSKTTSVATLVAQGNDLEKVNEQLDRLNWFTDETSYNFTDMVSNIAKFTASGKGLDESVTAMEGIANWAALSGQNATTASHAMYQLSQAMGAGVMRLEDYKSIQNASMDTEEFRQKCLDAGVALGTLKKNADGTYESLQATSDKGGEAFNISQFATKLTDGAWLTSDVMMKVFGDYSAAVDQIYDYAEEKGITASQAIEELGDEVDGFGLKAFKAAQEARTWGDAVDSVKDAVSTGWMNTFEIIFGNQEEATKLWTDLANAMYDAFASGAETRNELLQEWKDLGGRDALIEAFWNLWDGIASIISPIKEAFKDIFPPATAEQLYKITTGIRDLTAKIKLSDAQSERLKSTFKGLFGIVKIGVTIIKAIGSGIINLIGKFKGLGNGILGATGSLGDWISKISDSITESNTFGKAIDNVVCFLGKAIDKLKEFGKYIKGKIEAPGFDTFLNVLQTIWDVIKKVGLAVVKVASSIGKALGNAFRSGDIKSLLDLVNGGIFTGILLGLKKWIDGFKNFSDVGKNFVGTIKDVLGTVGDTLKTWQQAIKASAIKKIAVAIGILAVSLLILSKIDQDKLGSALGAITVLFLELIGAMKAFDKLGTGNKGAGKAATLMIGMSVAVLILASAVKKLSGMELESLAKSVAAVGILLAELVGAAKLMSIGGKNISKGAVQMVIMATALKILASVCEDLSRLSWESLGKGVAGIGAILLEFAGFQALMKLIKPKKMLSAALSLVLIGASMEIFANVCEKLGQMEWVELGKAGAAIGGILIIAAGFAKLASYSRKMIASSAALILIGAAMEIFADVCEKFGQMEWESLAKAGVAIGGILVLAAGFALLSGLSKKMISSVVALTIMAGAMEIFADVCEKFGQMEWESLAKAGVAIGGILALARNFALLAGLSSGILKSSVALLVMITALAIFVPVLKSLGGMRWGEIAKGLITIAGAFAIIGLAGLLLGPIVPSILALSGAIVLLGISCVAAGIGIMAFSAGLGALAGVTSAGAAAIVAALHIIIIGILKLIPAMIEVLTDAVVALCQVFIRSVPAIGEAIRVLVLELVKVLVECVPALADGALQLVTGVLEALVAYTPQIVDLLFQFLIGILDGVAKNLPALIQAVVNVFSALFSGVIDALNSMDPDTLVKGILGIGFMLSMMGALAAMAALAPAAMVGVLGFGAVVTELAAVLAILGGLAQIPGLEWLISEGGSFLQTIGTAIGKFLGGIIGGFAQGMSAALPQIGADLSAFMTNALPFIMGAKMIDSSSLEGVRSLVDIILALTGANILEGLTSWFTGGSSLTKFGEEIAAFAPSIKSYADTVKDIDASAVEASVNAAKCLSELATNLPNSGGLIGLLAGNNDIGAFGEQLPKLGAGLLAFSNAATGINPDTVTAAAQAAKALAEMASIIPNENGLVSWFTGDNSMASFAEQLPILGSGLAAFSVSVEGINIEAITAATSAAKALAEMASIIPNENGIVSWFTGDNSVANFAGQLPILGQGLSAFSTSVENLNIDNVAAATSAARALAEMASVIPNENGIVSWFTGDNSVANFAGQLPILGSGLAAFSESVSTINAENVMAATSAAKALAEMASVIPNENGIVSWFTGDNSVANFAGQLPILGAGLAEFSESVQNVNSEKITAAASAAKALAEMTEHIPTVGGIKAWFSGESGVAKFASNLPTLGDALKGFSDSVAGINPENVTAASAAAKNLAEMAETAPKNTDKLAKFGDNLTQFGEKLKTYFSKMKDIGPDTISTSKNVSSAISQVGTNINPSSIKSACEAINELVKTIKKCSSIKADETSGFVSSVKKLGTVTANALVKTFNESNSKMVDAGKKLISKFIEGMDSKQDAVSKSGKTLVSKASSAVKSEDQYSKFKSAGKYLGDGLVEGINAKQQAAYDAGYALGQKAAQGEKDGQKSNSPSKLTIQAGKWLGEGLVIGIQKMFNPVYNAGHDLGETATGTISSAISKLVDVMDSDIDMQPTIRPVLDLSDIESGAGTINGMLSLNPAITATNRVGSINSNMRRVGQNGTAEDITSAIEDLGRKMDNMSGDTYNINGVTYDDDSSIANAVKTIVRAARVERRA
jgi:tape measure domain-containing protein